MKSTARVGEPLAPEVIGTPPTCWQFSDSLPIPSGPLLLA